MNTYYSPIGINNSDESYSQILYYQGLAKMERREIRHVSNLLGLAILAFELTQVFVAVFFTAFPQLNELYESSAVFQDSSNIIFEFFGLAVPFGLVALVSRKRYKESIIPDEKIGFAKAVRWIAFGMLGCMAADYITDGVIVLFNLFGYDLDYPDILTPDSVLSCILSLVATAAVPALCEEFAMRCCSLGLMRNYGKAFGVVTVSVIFGLLHGNIIQFVFAGLVGLVLGYVTVKTGSIWPAIFIHGFNNAISALGSIAEYVNKGEVGNWFYYVVFGFWIAVGIIGTVVIFFKGEFKNTEQKSAPLPYSNSFGSKLGAFFSAPFLLLSFPFLIFTTVLSIVPIE